MLIPATSPARHFYVFVCVTAIKCNTSASYNYCVLFTAIVPAIK